MMWIVESIWLIRCVWYVAFIIGISGQWMNMAIWRLLDDWRYALKLNRNLRRRKHWRSSEDGLSLHVYPHGYGKMLIWTYACFFYPSIYRVIHPFVRPCVYPFGSSSVRQNSQSFNYSVNQTISQSVSQSDSPSIDTDSQTIRISKQTDSKSNI